MHARLPIPIYTISYNALPHFLLEAPLHCMHVTLILWSPSVLTKLISTVYSTLLHSADHGSDTCCNGGHTTLEKISRRESHWHTIHLSLYP